ncbi:hypothetical protein [Gordonia sihwensis]|uniref:hypothetical protein n=1 Tax=Gordonia sihwensis TaxID=173559 RepID=UPI003D998A22
MADTGSTDLTIMVTTTGSGRSWNDGATTTLTVAAEFGRWWIQVRDVVEDHVKSLSGGAVANVHHNGTATIRNEVIATWEVREIVNGVAQLISWED